MQHLPFEIKVNAVITRASGDREDLGTIGSITLGPKLANDTDKKDKEQPS
jgi:hypothetical protein